MFAISFLVRTSNQHSAESTGLLALVRIPGAEVGTVGPGVVTLHTAGRLHPLAQPAAEAALGLVLVAGGLRQGGAVGELVPAGVGRVGGQALTQTAALTIFNKLYFGPFW